MTNEAVEREIDRLRNPDILQLEQVKRFGAWVDDRRKLGQPGRAVGNTGLGKTSAAMAKPLPLCTIPFATGQAISLIKVRWCPSYI